MRQQILSGFQGLQKKLANLIDFQLRLGGQVVSRIGESTTSDVPRKIPEMQDNLVCKEMKVKCALYHLFMISITHITLC